MPLPLAQLLVTALFVYAALGAAFALAFLALGLARVDPVAHGASLGLRALLFPGCVALWPWLLVRWLRRATPREERTPHRTRAGGGA